MRKKLKDVFREWLSEWLQEQQNKEQDKEILHYQGEVTELKRQLTVAKQQNSTLFTLEEVKGLMAALNGGEKKMLESEVDELIANMLKLRV